MDRKVRAAMLHPIGNPRNGRTIGALTVGLLSSVEFFFTDLGSALTPKDKRQPPPHLGSPRPSKESPKREVRSPKKRAPLAYTRKIEGLIDPAEKPPLNGASEPCCYFTSALTLFTDLAPTTEHKPIATLEHGLERVLFKLGITFALTRITY
jgi:hypothetical protein